MAAYRVMPEEELLSIAPVRVDTGWLDRRRVRVICESCGEGINYEREVRIGGRTVCRPCSGEGYYAVRQTHREGRSESGSAVRVASRDDGHVG